MSRGAQFFQLLAGKDIKSNQMDLCVTMLSCLRGGHVDDLARAALDHHEPVLAQGRTLHGVGGGSTSIGAVESVLMLHILVISQCSMEGTRGARQPALYDRGGGNGQYVPESFHTCASSAIMRIKLESKERSE